MKYTNCFSPTGETDTFNGDYRDDNAEPATESPRIALERADLIAKLLDRLTPRQREVISLYYLEHKTEQAVAIRLGIKRGTVNDIRKRATMRMAVFALAMGIDKSF